MSIEIIDDFFSTDDFAVVATYTPSGGQPKSINVIYDNDYVASLMEGIEVENTSPAVLCKTSDILNVKHGDTLVVNSITYKIIEVKPDGTGITTLILSLH